MNGATPRLLPIRLPPVSGESLDSWFAAYSARLAVPLRDLVAACGLDDAFAQQSSRSIALGRNLGDREPLARATGVDGPALDLLWKPAARYAREASSRFIGRGQHRMATPLAWSRFCPPCLAATAGRWKFVWRLPWHTACAGHGSVLRDRCPCGEHLRHIVEWESTRVRRRRDRCAHALTSNTASADLDLAPVLALQRAVDPALAPDASDQERSDALEVLADVLVIAARMDSAFRARTTEVAPATEMAPVLARAWRLYSDDEAKDEFARLVAHDSQGPGVVPPSWAGAGPALLGRFIRTRDAHMLAVDRLRWRSTTTPRRPTEDELKASTVRARYAPEALWADWAIRLTPKAGVDPASFRVVAAAALLVPGTPRPLSCAFKGTCHERLSRNISHTLAPTGGGSDITPLLRALTELADGLDAHGGMIDYQRRRELACSDELLTRRDWQGITSAAGLATGRARKLCHARLWIYEALTGGPLRSAPADLRPDEAALASYHSFVLRIPARAAELLDAKARQILARSGIDEPLRWSPPREWVHSRELPGSEPEDIDFDRVIRLLRARRGPRAVADALGVTLDHVHFAVQHHRPETWASPSAPQPRTRYLRPFPAELTAERLRNLVVDERRGVKSIARDYDVDRKTIAAALVRENIPMGPPGGRARFAIDEDWLRTEYIDKRRPLPDIARELGTTPTNLSRIAKKLGIPLRGRGGPSHAESLAPPCADLPLPLAVAMAGQGGRERVRRFQVLARSASICQAAMRLGCHEVALFSQLTRLERDCGAALVVRYTRAHQRQQLTPLGQGLLDQADDHLGRPSLVLLADVPPPLALALGSLQGAGRVWRFLAVAKEGSIAAAARSLGTEQCIVSTQMAALELICGGRLFHRSAGVRAPQRLTDLGDLLVEQATLHVMSAG